MLKLNSCPLCNSPAELVEDARGEGFLTAIGCTNTACTACDIAIILAHATQKQVEAAYVKWNNLKGN